MSLNPSTIKGPVPALIEQSVRTVIGAIQQIASGGTPTLTPAQRRAFEQAGGRIVQGGRAGGGLQYLDPQGNRIDYRSARIAAREGFPSSVAAPPPTMGQPTPPRTNLPVPAGRVPPGPKVPAPRAPLPGLPRVPAGLPGTVAGYVIGTIATPSIVNILERAVRYDLVTEWQAEGRARRKGPTKRTARRRADRGTTALLRAQAGLQTAPAPTRPAERAPPRLRSARVKVPKYRPNLAGIPMPTPTIPRPAPTVSSVLASTPTWAREALIGGALALATSSSSRRARARAQEPLIPSLPPGLTDPLTGFQPGTVPFPSSGFAGDSGLPPGTPGTHTCECKPKRKRKPSKPRTRCYRGSFTETRRGTRKYSKVRIPCQ